MCLFKSSIFTILLSHQHCNLGLTKAIYCALSVSGTSSLPACITMGLPGGDRAGGSAASNEAYGAGVTH